MPKLPHIRSPQYRTAVIDAAQTVHMAQAHSDRILVSFTRLEFISTGEEVVGQFVSQTGNIETSGIPSIEGAPQKTFEFTADMSPDQALLVVNNILEALAKIPVEKKAQYGIPTNIAPYPSIFRAA